VTYRDGSFNQRFGAMGDQAEEAFDKVFPQHHKLGLNRPPFSMKGMPATLRYTPDRLTSKGFTEVMGVGADQTLKIKHEKLEALDVWQKLGVVYFFVYDSHNDRWWHAAMHDWNRVLALHATEGAFKEGKTYRALHTDHFPVDAEPMPDV